ncbi:hypothetical protein ACTXT7_014645 [Hymenolepis weldensis]
MERIPLKRIVTVVAQSCIPNFTPPRVSIGNGPTMNQQRNASGPASAPSSETKAPGVAATANLNSPKGGSDVGERTREYGGFCGDRVPYRNIVSVSRSKAETVVIKAVLTYAYDQYYKDRDGEPVDD